MQIRNTTVEQKKKESSLHLLYTAGNESRNCTLYNSSSFEDQGKTQFSMLGKRRQGKAEILEWKPALVAADRGWQNRQAKSRLKKTEEHLH